MIMSSSEMMWDIILNLQIWECKITDVIYDNLHNIVSISFMDKDEVITVMITNIEKDNFLLRADVFDNFDRWSNCAFEEEYKWKDFYEDRYNPIVLYKELLLIYYNMYKNLE